MAKRASRTKVAAKKSAKKVTAKRAVAKRAAAKPAVANRAARITKASAPKVRRRFRLRLPVQQIRQSDAVNLAGEVHVEPVDDLIQQVASHVITDWATLRDKALTAMGEFADSVESPAALLARVKGRKPGPGQIFQAHPLDLVVQDGPTAINSRDFTTPAMITRVAELAVSIAARGVRRAAPVYIDTIDDEQRFVLKGGHTRMRAFMTCYLLRDSGLLGGKVPTTFPITMEEKNTNDVARLLDFDADNDTKPLEPIERAILYRHAQELGATPERISELSGRSLVSVKNLLAMVAMPEAVLNLVRQGTISLTFGHKCWTQTNKNRDETLKMVTDAVEVAKTTGSKRVMPRHAGLTTTRGASASVATPAATPASTKASQTALERKDAEINSLRRLLNEVSGMGRGMSVKEDDGFITAVLEPMRRDEYQQIAGKIGWLKADEPAEAEPDKAAAA